jgi:NAD(P)-dependent dehydrogenase (short-subunit alcohol dehydrogenase family)
MRSGMNSCDGRVAIVTGGGRGIGRAYALELAREGASVVVNDLGSSTDGSGRDASAAQSVVDEITAVGGRAIASTHDVSEWEDARNMVQAAIQSFGTLDVLINNAGILRDRTLASMTIDEWDSVIKVHLRGTFAPCHFAAGYWRQKAKVSGPVGARIINTSSGSGMYGNFGQSNYSAAKAGIAGFTLTAAKELATLGVTANAIAPLAVTRLNESLIPEQSRTERKSMSRPEQIAPLVAWLASTESAFVTGRVFQVGTGRIELLESWRVGAEVYKDGQWETSEIGKVIPDLLERAAPNPDIHGHVPQTHP